MTRLLPPRIRALIDACEGPDILDVGCVGQDPVFSTASNTWLHGHLRKRFPKVYGIDLDGERLAELKSAGFDNLTYGDAATVDLEQSFDSIVAGEIIEHVTDVGRFLNNLRGHLKPGGAIVLSTPYVFGLSHVLYGWRKYPRTCSNGEHTIWLCPATLTQVASRCALRVDELTLVKDFTVPDGASRRPYFVLMRIFAVASRVLPSRVFATSFVAVLRDART